MTSAFAWSVTKHVSAGENTDKVLPRLSRNVGQDLVLIVQFDSEHCIRQCFQHRRRYLDCIFLRHLLWGLTPAGARLWKDAAGTN